MFGKSKKPKESKASNSTAASLGKKSAPSVISADMNVLGSIISDGFIDIDGKVDGNVKCDSAIIRSNGVVKGDVVANTVQIYGHIEGLVHAGSVGLYHSAHVIGTIMHESLTIEDGAFVDGKFKRLVRSEQPAEDEAPMIDVTRAAANDDDEDGEAHELQERMMDNLKLISG